MTDVMHIIFGDIEIYLPRSLGTLAKARRLLDMLEEDIVAGWVCKHCGCTENLPCPGGCFWVAPNVCSRCAEKEKHETPQNVEKHISQSSGADEPKNISNIEDLQPEQADVKCDKIPRDTTKCPKCGSTKRWKSGKVTRKGITFQKYECKNKKCDHVYVGEKIAEPDAPKIEPETVPGAPVDFVVRAGAGGPVLTKEETSNPVFIPEYKTRKSRVQEGLAEGLTNEQISEKYNVPMGETNMLVNIIKKNSVK